MGQPKTRPAADEAGYWELSRRPLQILTFLLPLIIAYEIGLAWLLRSEEGVLTNKAHETLLVVLNTLGVNAASGLYLGGIVIVVVLSVWHVLNRDPWSVSLPGVGLMAIESIILTVPLIVMGMLIQRSLVAAGGAPVELDQLRLGSKLAISIGAGLYEELVFRMLLIAVIHTLLVDMLSLKHAVGVAVAVLVSAAAFTWYHPLSPDGTLDLSRVAFYFLAGLYFGAVYVWRGFGIVVAVHAFYDVLTVGFMS